MTAQPKVLVVGLDAAEKDVVLEGARSGWLPTFRRLLDTGAWGLTNGPLGMHAASAWHTLVTAVSPARHGRHADRQIRVGTYRMDRFLPADLKREPFWNVVSRAQRRVVVIDVPYVAPSRGLNGIHVVDWTTHAADNGFATWPPQLAAEVRQQFGTDPVGLCDHKQLRDAAQVGAFRDALIARVEMKKTLSTELLRRGPWDVFVTVFGESHCIGHQCWHLHDPDHPQYDRAVAAVVGDPLRAVYIALDAAMGKLIDGAGPDTTTVVISSHGMGPNFLGAHLLGEILARLGHRPAPSPPRRPWRALQWSWRRLPLAVRSQLMPFQKHAVDLVWPGLDGRAQCFDVPNGEVYGAIRVNLVGREPHGTIRPGSEYERFCTTLTHELSALINADTGAPAIRGVLRTGDIDAGPYLADLPDLLIEWNTEAPLNAVSSARTGTIRGTAPGSRTGHHRPQGLFFVSGPGIRSGEIRESVSTMDLAPTIATLVGVELPDVDGHPIVACVGPQP